jgi:negative regulator of flagellin synthesis FlgM
MVGEINGPGSGSIKSVKGQTTAGERRVGEAPVAAGKAGADVVTLTDFAARLQALIKSVDSLPQVDQQRVAEFRQALDDGSYLVDPRAVADKLLAFETQLAAAGA